MTFGTSLHAARETPPWPRRRRANHWEVAHLASVVPLARGWERQLDEKANPLFYDGRRLTPERYHRWLRESAVRWVALPDAQLDYSATGEARLLRAGLGACVSEAPGGWTRVTPMGDGPVQVRAGLRLRDEPDCTQYVAAG